MMLASQAQQAQSALLSFHGSEVFVITAMLLMVIGMAIVLLKRNMLKMALGFSVVDTGVNLLIVAFGYQPNRTAPIIDDKSMFANFAHLLVNPAKVVDPVPQALVLTAIVIGVGVTALMLTYIVRLYANKKTLDIRAYGRLKW